MYPVTNKQSTQLNGAKSSFRS